jgi:hypothetical protein
MTKVDVITSIVANDWTTDNTKIYVKLNDDSEWTEVSSKNPLKDVVTGMFLYYDFDTSKYCCLMTLGSKINHAHEHESMFNMALDVRFFMEELESLPSILKTIARFK